MNAEKKKARVRMHGKLAGVLVAQQGGGYRFQYERGYSGPPISLTMPVRDAPYIYERFPPFFDGLLPEGWRLDALLLRAKLDRHDYMGQLLAVGGDLVGAVTVE